MSSYVPGRASKWRPADYRTPSPPTFDRVHPPPASFLADFAQYCSRQNRNDPVEDSIQEHLNQADGSIPVMCGGRQHSATQYSVGIHSPVNSRKRPYPLQTQFSSGLETLASLAEERAASPQFSPITPHEARVPSSNGFTDSRPIAAPAAEVDDRPETLMLSSVTKVDLDPLPQYTRSNASPRLASENTQSSHWGSSVDQVTNGHVQEQAHTRAHQQSSPAYQPPQSEDAELLLSLRQDRPHGHIQHSHDQAMSYPWDPRPVQGFFQQQPPRFEQLHQHYHCVNTATEHSVPDSSPKMLPQAVGLYAHASALSRPDEHGDWPHQIQCEPVFPETVSHDPAYQPAALNNMPVQPFSALTHVLHETRQRSQPTVEYRKAPRRKSTVRKPKAERPLHVSQGTLPPTQNILNEAIIQHDSMVAMNHTGTGQEEPKQKDGVECGCPVPIEVPEDAIPSATVVVTEDQSSISDEKAAGEDLEKVPREVPEIPGATPVEVCGAELVSTSKYLGHVESAASARVQELLTYRTRVHPRRRNSTAGDFQTPDNNHVPRWSRCGSVPLDQVTCRPLPDDLSAWRKLAAENRQKQKTTTCGACKFSRTTVGQEELWIGCNGCKQWYHFACAGFKNSREVRTVDKYFCKACKPKHGGTTYVRKSKRIHNNVDYAGFNEGVLRLHDDTKEHHYIQPIKDGEIEFTPEKFARVAPELVTAEWFERGSFTEPIVIPASLNPKQNSIPAANAQIDVDLCGRYNEQEAQTADQDQEPPVDGFEYEAVPDNGQDKLDMIIPQGLTVRRVADLYGPNEKVDVINVKAQGEDKRWTLKEWADYYEDSGDKPVRNVISLEFSGTRLGRLVQRPKVVRELDLQDSVWPKDAAKQGTSVSFYCLMSVADCYTDFHVDFGGSSVYYHIIKGKKTFFFIPPTKTNLKQYERWCQSPAQNHTFLGKECKECYRVDLSEGDTMLIPSGWIHAVWTPEDSLVIGGNFLTRLHYSMQLDIVDIEKKTKVPRKFRYPFFQKVMWFAVLKYLRDDPLPPEVFELFSDKHVFNREAPVWQDYEQLDSSNAKYYSQAELDGLPDLVGYVFRTVLISLGKVEGIPQDVRKAVTSSLPKGHGDLLEVVKSFAMWVAWKRGDKSIPAWALPNAELPDASAEGGKKLSTAQLKKLERQQAAAAPRSLPDRQSTRRQPVRAAMEQFGQHTTTEKTSVLGPKRVACDGCRKRKMACKHKINDTQNTESVSHQMPVPSAPPVEQSVAVVIPRYPRIYQTSQLPAPSPEDLRTTNGKGRSKACAECRKSKRRCIHDAWGSIDPVKAAEAPVVRGKRKIEGDISTPVPSKKSKSSVDSRVKPVSGALAIRNTMNDSDCQPRTLQTVPTHQPPTGASFRPNMVASGEPFKDTGSPEFVVRAFAPMSTFDPCGPGLTAQQQWVEANRMSPYQSPTQTSHEPQREPSSLMNFLDQLRVASGGAVSTITPPKTASHDSEDYMYTLSHNAALDDGRASAHTESAAGEDDLALAQFQQPYAAKQDDREVYHQAAQLPSPVSPYGQTTETEVPEHFVVEDHTPSDPSVQQSAPIKEHQSPVSGNAQNMAAKVEGITPQNRTPIATMTQSDAVADREPIGLRRTSVEPVPVDQEMELPAELEHEGSTSLEPKALADTAVDQRPIAPEITCAEPIVLQHEVELAKEYRRRNRPPEPTTLADQLCDSTPKALHSSPAELGPVEHEVGRPREHGDEKGVASVQPAIVSTRDSSTSSTTGAPVLSHKHHLPTDPKHQIHKEGESEDDLSDLGATPPPDTEIAERERIAKVPGRYSSRRSMPVDRFSSQNFKRPYLISRPNGVSTTPAATVTNNNEVERARAVNKVKTPSLLANVSTRGNKKSTSVHVRNGHSKPRGSSINLTEIPAPAKRKRKVLHEDLQQAMAPQKSPHQAALLAEVKYRGMSEEDRASYRLMEDMRINDLGLRRRSRMS